MHLAAVSVLALLYSVATARGYDPSPNPEAVVQVGKARFTVLTEHLVRMEWGGANDAATFAFINRNLPTPKFTTSKDGNWTIIKTSAVEVHYLSISKDTFNPNNLKAVLQLNGKTVSWSPTPAIQESAEGNLLGTLRTLDRVNGAANLDCYSQNEADLHCQLGLVSQNGYVVVDDTNRPQFDASPWPWVVNKTYPIPSYHQCSSVDHDQRQLCGYLDIEEFDCTGAGCCYDKSASHPLQKCYYGTQSYRDLYFFGHGHNYKLALKEFTMIAGRIPIPPRYAFGIFYSRYWAYDDIGEMKIVRGYKERSIPLDVLVIDMDWHITYYSAHQRDQAGERKGWTGFTWDKHLFPDPKLFLDWCKTKGLKNTVNCHPASGIQPWEENYEEMAKAMGIDPTTKKYVPFVPSDKQFVTNWFEIVLGARESEGIDFWWLDWQQGESWISIPLVNPTIWLNYIFFTNPFHWKNNTVRPFLLHRWGGLGNHRYQVGFSGDVIASWDSLNFQVTFTITATNVGFGYWSHDIGGHRPPAPSPELYTRWIQWGIFSPIFRTHPSKDTVNVRRIWLFPVEAYNIMRSAFRLRARLLPYTYSNARVAYDEGLSMLRPMYYEYPESPEAYTFNKQYFFGPSLLVAPITSPMDNRTNLTSKTVWIPKSDQGSYISWFSGEMFPGGQVYDRNYSLSEIPLFVQAGSIIPMKTEDFEPLGSAQVIPTVLTLMVFVGDMSLGNGELYEDDGKTTQYISGKYTNTIFSFANVNNVLKVTVQLVQVGQYDGQPISRCYQICIPNFRPADRVAVTGTAQNLPYVTLLDSFVEYDEDSWTFDGSTLSLIVNLVTERPVDKEVEVVIDYSSFKSFDPYGFPGFPGMLTRLQQMKELLDDQWGIDTVYQDQYPSLLYATETGRMITAKPSLVISGIMDQFKNNLTNGIGEVERLANLNSVIKERILASLHQSSWVDVHTTRSRIFD